MNCKNCKFFKRVSCHGHGEFWGGCKLYDNLTNSLLDALKSNDINIHFVIFNNPPYCYPETECIFNGYIGDIYKYEKRR